MCHNHNCLFIISESIVAFHVGEATPFPRPSSPWNQTIGMDRGLEERPQLRQETRGRREYYAIKDRMERIVALAEVLKTRRVSSSQLMYETSVARALLLSQIKLTLCTLEIEAKRATEQEWMIDLSNLCTAIHLYNSEVVPVVKWVWHGDHVIGDPATHSTKVALADVCDSLVTSHARNISQKLLEAFFKSGTIQESFRHVREHEENIIRVVIATLAKHTSLLEEQTHIHSRHSQYQPTASFDSVATIAREYWTEHRHLAMQLEGRIWKEVAVHLRSVSSNSLQSWEELEKELQQLAIG